MKPIKKTLKAPLDKILSYKPNEAPRQPSKQPSKAELEQVYNMMVSVL